MRPIKPKNFNPDDLPKISENLKELVNGVTDLAKALNVPGYEPKILELRTRVLDYLRDSRDYVLWLEYHYEHEGKDELEKHMKSRYEAEAAIVKDDITKAVELLIGHSNMSLYED